jgi:hypothetical protein
LAEVATATLVRLKFAAPLAPFVVAATVKAPAVLFAVQADEVATPLELVVSVSVAPPAKAQLAPEAGAVKVTETPLAGAPSEVTVADKAANAVPTDTLFCSVPPVAVIAIVGVGFEELELLQPVNKPKARQTTMAKIPI